MKRERPLSPKQQRFIDEYLVDLNATQAYQRAGYHGTGNGAEVNAHRLLRSAKVAAAIHAAQVARSHRTHITQDAVLHEIALLQHSDVTHYQVDDYGNVTLAASAPPEAMRAVASLRKKIVHTEAGISYETELKLWNKPAALRMGGDHLGLFKKGEGLQELGAGLAALLAEAKAKQS
jgi:phage terminase small subunit